LSREGEPVLGVLVTHGAMARGMVDAVERIAGSESDPIRAVSNEGRSPEDLARHVDELIGDRSAVVFTDLETGSCALAGRLVCREEGRRALLFGVNLPMLLDFVFHREMAIEELVPRLMKKGRGAVKCVPESLSHADPALPG